jgi:hypothetical protein
MNIRFQPKNVSKQNNNKSNNPDSDVDMKILNEIKSENIIVDDDKFVTRKNK